MTESFIPGKDAALEISIERMQQRLTELGFHIEEHQWLNPVANVWSVHIRDRDCPLLFTNGKGASRLAALASALGEFLERLSCNYFWADYYLGDKIANATFVHYPSERWFDLNADGEWPEDLLTPELVEFYNPQGNLELYDLVDINSGNDERGVCALPYQRQRDHQTIWFPVNIIGNLYVSNGMSAGNTPAEARVQALSEILERYIKFKIIGEGLCLPDVPEEVIARYPKIQEGVEALREAGFGIVVKDASLGGRYPVMNVTLLNPHDQGCYASFGAHPRFEVALERALTELLQGRALDKLAGFAEPGFNLEEIAHPHNLETHFIDSSGIIHWDFLSYKSDYIFADWDFTGTTEEEFKYLCDLIHDEDCDIYIMDYDHLGMYGCRILVPSMSEIYPPEDLEWDNNNTGNPLREPILSLAELEDDECGELYDAIEELGLDDMQPVAALIGLAPEPGTLWSDMRVGELKTLLALAIEDEEAALEGCDWIRHFEQLDSERRRVYRCIEVLLGMDDTSRYSKGIVGLFGRETVAKAEALINGTMRFWNVPSPTLALKGCEMHQSLLEAYGKIHPQLANLNN